MKNPYPAWARRAWRCSDGVPVDQWAEENVVLPPGVSSQSGPISLDWTPYVREILRAATDPQVEEITFCASTQVAKTLTLTLIALHSIFVRRRPAQIVMPRESDARDLNIERIRPTVMASPNLARELTGTKHETTADALRVRDIVLHFIGANSPAALAGRAKGTLILDETDKYPPWSGREADPISLARERTRTFFDRVIVKASTPTTEHGYILRELADSTDERYHVPCPHCGAYQELVMGTGAPGSGGVKWPAGADTQVIVNESSAYYECAACGEKIFDEHKQKMLRSGIWVPRGVEIDKRGQLIGTIPSRKRVGFHLWAAYSPWLTFSEIAAAFLRAKGRDETLMNFRNSWQAEPWHLSVGELKTDRLEQLREGFFGDVDEAASALTAGVDVQSEGGRTFMYLVIRAWGPKEQSWLVRAARVESWEALYTALFHARYQTPNGRTVDLAMVAVDSGYRSDEVYQFCEFTGATAVRGASSRPQRPITLSKGKLPATTIPLLLLDTSYLKSRLRRLIDSGVWKITEDTTEEYVRHMAAEQQVRQTNKRTGRVELVWKVTRPGAPNHFFDAEVYALAAADYYELTRRDDPYTENERDVREVTPPPVRRITSNLMREGTL